MRRGDHAQKARLLQLLRMLCTKSGVRAAEAAEYFGVARRTIYRDFALIARYFPLTNGKEGKRIDTASLYPHSGDLSNAMLQAFAQNAALNVPYLDAHSNKAAIRFAVDYRKFPKVSGSGCGGGKGV